jgi:type IV pilus assembly protein PilC
LPEYKYEAVSQNGKKQKGRINAGTQLEALQLLNSHGYVVTSINVISKERKSNTTALFPIGKNELSIFARQLSTMVSSGVRIREALQVLSNQQVFSGRFRKILSNVVVSIEGGLSFSEALEKTGVFDKLFINLVRAGEAGGVLDESLERVADFYEGMVDLQNQVKSAMSYPLFMMAFAIGIVGVISFFILPNLISAFGGNFEPSGMMGILLSMNEILKNYWLLILIGAVGLFVGLRIFMKTKYGKLFKEKLGSLIPPIRRLRDMTALERFTRTLAVLVSSGVDLPTGLELAGEVSESPKVYKATINAVEAIKGGESIHTALEKQKVFPSIVISMIATGEETGKLDDVMFKVSVFYHAQVTTALKKLVSLVEPIMIMFIGGFIGFLAYTMYDAIFAMEQSIG